MSLDGDANWECHPDVRSLFSVILTQDGTGSSYPQPEMAPYACQNQWKWFWLALYMKWHLTGKSAFPASSATLLAILERGDVRICFFFFFFWDVPLPSQIKRRHSQVWMKHPGLPLKRGAVWKRYFCAMHHHCAHYFCSSQILVDRMIRTKTTNLHLCLGSRYCRLSCQSSYRLLQKKKQLQNEKWTPKNSHPHFARFYPGKRNFLIATKMPFTYRKGLIN